MIVAGECPRFQRLNEWREKRKELYQIATGGCELFRICVVGASFSRKNGVPGSVRAGRALHGTGSRRCS